MTYENHPTVTIGRQRRMELLQDARTCLDTGEPLPTQADYADRWDTGISSVSRALRLTRRRGLLVTERRDGRSYVVRVG